MHTSLNKRKLSSLICREKNVSFVFHGRSSLTTSVRTFPALLIFWFWTRVKWKNVTDRRWRTWPVTNRLLLPRDCWWIKRRWRCRWYCRESDTKTKKVPERLREILIRILWSRTFWVFLHLFPRCLKNRFETVWIFSTSWSVHKVQ